MAAPRTLTNVATAVTIDGTDLHIYGMIVEKIDNPMPSARKSTQVLFNRDGDFDYTKNYDIRTMRITGSIIGDSNSDLLSRIDSLKTFFRLRENGDSFQVIFNNQSTRYWTCKFDGGFSLDYLKNWYAGRIVNYSLTLKCTKLYAEKTTATTLAIKHTIFRDQGITYGGTYPAPVSLKINSPMDKNWLDAAAAGNASEDHTKWTFSNATGTTETGNLPTLGTNTVKATQSSAGAYYAEINCSSVLVTSKNYVFAGFVRTTTSLNKGKLEIIQNGAGGNLSAFIPYGDHFVFKIITKADLVGMTSIKIRFSNDGTDANFEIYGCFIYEITDAEAVDVDFFPPPYIQDSAGDHMRETVNPKLRIINGYNLMVNGHGDDNTGWGTGANYVNHVVDDPLDQTDKCISIWAHSGTSITGSWFTSVRPGKYYRIQFKYMVTQYYDGPNQMIRMWGSADGNYSGTAKNPAEAMTGSVVNLTGVNTSWQSVDVEVYAYEYMSLLWLLVTIYDPTIVLIKDIQIYEEAAVGGPVVAYQNPPSNYIQWTGTLEALDTLMINGESMVATLVDDSANDIVNAMSGFVGEKGLFLYPGSNILKYEDARVLSATPQVYPGAANVLLSYRERYI
jgi:hypothetical protein